MQMLKILISNQRKNYQGVCTVDGACSSSVDVGATRESTASVARLLLQ